MKQEKEYLGVYLNNKTRKGIDWPNVVKELRVFLSECNEEKLDNLKWEIMRYKKSYDMNNYFATYSVLIAVLAVLFSFIDIDESASDLVNSTLWGALLILFIIVMIQFIKSTGSYMRSGHYFDIYYRLIEEEIINRVKKKEQYENQNHSKERVEFIKQSLALRRPINIIRSIFKD